MLEDEEFKVMGFEVWSDEKTSCIFLELEVWKLPETKKLRGPHVFSKLHSKQFIEKYRKSGKIYVEDIYWFAEVKRKFRDADKKLKDFLSQPKKDLIENGIGSYLSENISKDFRILKDQEVLRLVHKNPEFGCVLNWYFKRDLI
jgi:tRNA nucleotidyltransferase (CCA-adding enzyme)